MSYKEHNIEVYFLYIGFTHLPLFKVDFPYCTAFTGPVYEYAIKYRSNIDQLTDDELKASKPLSLLTDDTISFINETCSQIQVKSQLRNPHNLNIKHKEESAYRKKRDKELKQASFNTNYYNITKSKYRDNEAMLPIDVSDGNINRAYRILDALIYTIEDMEGYISVGIDSGKDKAMFVIMNVSFYFEMLEHNPKKKQSLNEDERLPLFGWTH